MNCWRSLFGNKCQLVINDFDIAFFGALGDRSQELAAKATLTEQFPDYKFDVKNQASFARWRPGRTPYNSTEDGVTDWLHTATAVGVRLDDGGQWQLFTPYGLVWMICLMASSDRLQHIYTTQMLRVK